MLPLVKKVVSADVRTVQKVEAIANKCVRKGVRKAARVLAVEEINSPMAIEV